MLFWKLKIKAQTEWYWLQIEYCMRTCSKLTVKPVYELCLAQRRSQAMLEPQIGQLCPFMWYVGTSISNKKCVLSKLYRQVNFTVWLSFDSIISYCHFQQIWGKGRLIITLISWVIFLDLRSASIFALICQQRISPLLQYINEESLGIKGHIFLCKVSWSSFDVEKKFRIRIMCSEVVLFLNLVLYLDFYFVLDRYFNSNWK